ncbi:RTA1 like protein-domain-containing protein [Mycena sanguinolenta]|nr:RTA1 like protein-domain-containing protein [Mycena sanguinolenta]
MNTSASLAALARFTIRDDSTTDLDDSQYGYTPQEWVAILFLALFGISTVLHAAQATYFRMWWLFPTAVLCGLGELAGWVGRLWSSQNPEANTPFIIQICCTIIAPTPLLAASFMIMSRLVGRLGTSYSLLTPKWFTILFLPCDLIALVVQGVGGGMASSANTLAGANKGANVMLGGIGFQFAVIIIFTALASDFSLRYMRNKPIRTSEAPRGALTLRLKLMASALAFSTVVLIVRSIYRLIELSGGWDGHVIRTEVYFNVLDGGMVTLAIFTLNFVHPGLFLQPAPEDADYAAVKLKSLRNSNDKSISEA